MKMPLNLPNCDPGATVFPIEWKEAYFRRNYNNQLGGYVCPDCLCVFSGYLGFQQLQGDHVKPRSKGGKTEWENFTLRCRKCNLAKSNK